MNNTITADEIGRQLNQRMSQASYQRTEVPTWLHPTPAPIAEAAEAVDAAWALLVDAEDDCQGALGAINTAATADAAAIREAARAGKPLPKPVDQERLRRELAYKFEQVLPLFAKHSQAESRLKTAVDDAHLAITTAAVAEARRQLTAYKANVDAAHQAALDAGAAYGQAVAALAYVSQLPQVRDRVQFHPGGDGAVRVEVAPMGANAVHQDCAMLEERGLTIAAPKAKAAS